MTSSKERKRSELATALQRLLDDSDLLSRSGWARVLGVSPPAISMWVNDRTLPRPEHLRQVLDFVETSSGVPRQVLDDFRRAIAMPAHDATPFATRLRGEPTMAHYMLRPLREAFLRTLGSLEPAVQEDLLYSTADACRQLLDASSGAHKLVGVPWMLRPGARLHLTRELPRLFEVPWQSVTVSGREPRDGSESFFKEVAAHLLRRSDAPTGFQLNYVVAAANRDQLAANLKVLLSSWPEDERSQASERLKVVPTQPSEVEKLLSMFASESGEAEVLVAFDLGMSSRCGYVWYPADSASLEFGVVLSQGDILTMERTVAAWKDLLIFPLGERRERDESEASPRRKERK